MATYTISHGISDHSFLLIKVTEKSKSVTGRSAFGTMPSTDLVLACPLELPLAQCQSKGRVPLALCPLTDLVLACPLELLLAQTCHPGRVSVFWKLQVSHRAQCFAQLNCLWHNVLDQSAEQLDPSMAYDCFLNLKENKAATVDSVPIGRFLPPLLATCHVARFLGTPSRITRLPRRNFGNLVILEGFQCSLPKCSTILGRTRVWKPQNQCQGRTLRKFTSPRLLHNCINARKESR